MAESKALKLGQQVEIVWHDAWSSAASWSQDEVKKRLEKPLVLSSLGYVVESSANGIAIASERETEPKSSDEQSVRHLQVIPNEMIQSIRLLAKPRVRGNGRRDAKDELFR